MQTEGLKFLIDPVFSGNASPISSIVKAHFTERIATKCLDMPEIDYLLIFHGHWDHLDTNTIYELNPKIKNVICGLGVTQHFEFWVWDKSKLIERNWYDTIDLSTDF